MDLDPDWVVGFVDGEGCFCVSINPQSETIPGYQVVPEFRVVQTGHNVQVLYALKRFFRCGTVRRTGEDRYELRIRKLPCLQEVVAFFERHPLKTRKNVDFRKFARVVRLMSEERHLDPEGLIQIVRIALSMDHTDKARTQELLVELQQRYGRRDSPPQAEMPG